MMGLGWKTILGGVLIALGQLMGAAIQDCPVQSWIPWFKWLSGWANAAGVIFGAVGLSSKVATATNALTQSMDVNRELVSEAMQKQKVIVQEKVVEKRVPYVVKRVNPEDSVTVTRADGTVEKM